MATATYPSCSIKRHRRSKQDISRLEQAIMEIGEQERPFTCRQMFYRLVSARLIEKSENEYDNVVIRLCSKLREDGVMPWSWITDGTRLMRKPESFSNLAEALEITKECYRRKLWHEQDVYVEVWCEKDALTGVIYPITAKWDVPLMITRGFSSSTFLHGAAETIKEINKPTYIYYLGDYDPSGLHIWSSLQEKLRRYASPRRPSSFQSFESIAKMLRSADITFERIAITPEQVGQYKLPTRPTKKTGTHARGFVGLGTDGDSIEVDALPPQVLRDLVEKTITQHIDKHQLEKTLAVEESERETISEFAAQWEAR